jgi:hypothetical protein
MPATTPLYPDYRSAFLDGDTVPRPSEPGAAQAFLEAMATLANQGHAFQGSTDRHAWHMQQARWTAPRVVPAVSLQLEAHLNQRGVLLTPEFLELLGQIEARSVLLYQTTLLPVRSILVGHAQQAVLRTACRSTPPTDQRAWQLGAWSFYCVDQPDLLQVSVDAREPERSPEA